MCAIADSEGSSISAGRPRFARSPFNSANAELKGWPTGVTVHEAQNAPACAINAVSSAVGSTSGTGIGTTLLEFVGSGCADGTEAGFSTLIDCVAGTFGIGSLKIGLYEVIGFGVVVAAGAAGTGVAAGAAAGVLVAGATTDVVAAGATDELDTIGVELTTGGETTVDEDIGVTVAGDGETVTGFE